MKLICSLIFLSLSLKAYSRDIILVENLASKEEGQVLMNIIAKKFKIPKNLVSYKATKECSNKTEAIMHLCLKRDGELEIVKVNRFVVKNSLSAFYDEDLTEELK